MARAPAPRTMPGDFFVLTYDRDGGAYTLHVDDAGRSSYNLGSDIESVMGYFRTTDARELGYKAIDLAREFGAAQAVPSENRVFKVTPQPQRGVTKDMFTATKPGTVYLPGL